MLALEVRPARSRTEGSRSRVLALPLAMVCGGLAANVVLHLFHSHVGHDQSWNLYAAAEELRGVPLNGPTLVEVNPPFLLWFMSLPVLLGRLLHIGSIQGFRCFVLLAVGGTGAYSTLLYRRLQRPSPFALWSMVLCLLYGGMQTVQPSDVGQREHFVAFLLLPYLLGAAFRLRRRRLPAAESVLVGMLAAVAVCLKPQHAFEVLLMEAVVLGRLRNLRLWADTTWVTIAAAVAVYLLVLSLVTQTYLTQLVPLLADTYWGMNGTWDSMLLWAFHSLVARAVAVVLYVSLRRWLRMEVVAAALLTGGAGAMAAYFQQYKGWGYQALSLHIFSYLLVGLIAAEIFERLVLERPWGFPTFRWRGPSPVVAAVVVFALVLVGLGRHVRYGGYPNPVAGTLANVYGDYPERASVSFLSVQPWEFPSVLEQDKVWGGRYLHLWMLPAILRSEDPADSDAKHHLSAARVQELSAELRTTQAEDLEHWKPAVVAVDPCTMPVLCSTQGAPFYGSLLNWFLVDAQFRGQWAHYRLQKTVNGLAIYVRVD